MRDKKIFFALGFLLFVSLSFVSATTTLNSPKQWYNYSSVNFNCTTDLANPLNYTIYYNESGVSANTILFVSGNITSSATEFYNSSFLMSSFPDSRIYNFTCMVFNGTVAENSTQIINVTIDNTPPAVVFVTPVSGTNASGDVSMNASVLDSTSGVYTVYFNATDSSGVQAANSQGNNIGGGIYYNLTYVGGSLSDDNYDLYVYATDFSGNVNSTTISTRVSLDQTAPTITLTRTGSSSTTLEITAAVSDATSGISGACTIDRSGASVSATDLLNQIITESSLSCGNSYSYAVTCLDSAGNSKTETSSFSTTGCSAVSTTTSSTSTNTWTKTNVVSDDDFEKGFNYELKSKQRLKVKLGVETHYVGVKSLTNDKATIEIASDPIEVEMSIGEEKKFDVDNDGYYDIYVILNSIKDSVVDLTVQKINEEVPSDLGNSLEQDSTTNQDDSTLGETTTESEESGSSVWIWVIVGLIIVGIVIYFYKNLSNKSEKLKKKK